MKLCATIALLAVGIAAGCGGGKAAPSAPTSTPASTGAATTTTGQATTQFVQAPKHFTLTATSKCLTGKGIQASVTHQQMTHATGGQLSVTLKDGADMEVQFGKDSAEASALNKVDQSFAAAFGVKNPPVLPQKANVVFGGHGAPVAADNAVIYGCLA